MSAPDAKASRIGIFVDAGARVHDGALHVQRDASAFLTFALAVAKEVGPATLFCRELDRDADDTTSPIGSPTDARLCLLPGYGGVRDLVGMVRAVPGSVRALTRALDDLDVVWVFGPSPIAVLVAAIARVRGVRTVFGVRQDTIEYFRYRSGSSRARAAVMTVVHLMERSFRLLARGRDVTAVGTPAVLRYRPIARRVLPMRVTLSRGSAAEMMSARVPDEFLRVLTVGRFDPEKNPLLLLDTVQLLLDDPAVPRFVWSWIGDGPLLADFRSQAEERGLAAVVEAPGFVPQGPALDSRYASADLYVHIALTEGLPQVLYEAAGAGLPIIATDVGGVRAALADGHAGLLVPPADAPALATAISRLTADEPERRVWADRAVAELGGTTLDVEADRVAAFLSARS